MRQQPADVVVGRCHHPGVHLHFAGGSGPLRGRQVGPDPVGRRHRRQFGGRRYDAGGNGLLQTIRAHLVPAGVECTVVGIDIGLGRLHRDVQRLEREQGEEGPFRVALVDIFDHLVDKRARRIEVLGQGDRLAVLEPVHLVIAGQIGGHVEVAAACRVHHVGAIEAEPVGQVLADLANPPFAGHIGPVAGAGEQRCYGLLIRGKPHRIAGQRAHFSIRNFHQRAHADLVVVHAGEQHRPAWPAEGRRVIAR